MSSNDQAEASIDGTIEVENSEAPSHDLASTSGLEEPETVDPPEEVPLRPGHDHLGFLSWPRLDFDMDQGNHPSDETGSSHGSSQSASVGRNRVDGAVEDTKSTTNEDTPEIQNNINAEESSNNSSQEAASGANDGQYGPEALGEGVLEGPPNEDRFEKQRFFFPVHSAHDQLGFLSDQYPDPFDETEVSQGICQSASEARNRVDGAMEETKSMRNEENPEALERQRVLIQSTIQVVQDHPNFQNEIYEQVRTHAEMIVESIQTHLEGMNQSIPEMRVDEFNQMVRLTLENNFILPDDGVPPNVSPNVNDDAFRADSVSETGEVEFTAPTLQAQSNAAENSGSEPTKKGPQKYTSMTEKSHLPAEIQDSAPIEEQKNMEVSRKEWISCVPNQDLSSDLDLEPQKDREVAPSAKSQRQTGKERVKKKTADCSPPSEGHPREEQENEEVEVEQLQRVTENYANDTLVAASDVDTTTATEAFRSAHITGETDVPHLPGNEAESQQQPGSPNQDAIPEGPNYESAPIRDEESSDSDQDIEIHEA